MGRHFRILEKARLDKQLFGEEPAPVAPPTFPQPVEEVPNKPPLEPAVVANDAVAAEETITGAEEPKVEPAAPVDDPAPESRSEAPIANWRDEVAQVLGLDSLPAGARLGLCPIGRSRSAAHAGAALGRWLAARSTSPLVIVEANFDSPQLARHFRTRRLGLADAMAADNPKWEHFIHDTSYSNLKILPAGRNPGTRQLVAGQEALIRALDDLVVRFETVVVLFSNPRARGFGKLAVSRIAHYVIPIVEPGRVTASQANRAMRKLAASNARATAALVAPKSTLGDALRMERLTSQLGRPSRGDDA